MEKKEKKYRQMTGADDDKNTFSPKIHIVYEKYHPGGWKIHNPIRHWFFYFKYSCNRMIPAQNGSERSEPGG